MRIITYNLRNGGAARTHWQTILDQYDPEVFLVQESADPKLHLTDPRHKHRHAEAHWHPVSVPKLKWGSAVYVKGGASRLDLPSDFHGYVAGMEIPASRFQSTGKKPLRVFSVHAPPRGNYAKIVEAILDIIAKHRGDGDLIIGGDFNLTVSKLPDGTKMSIRERGILPRLQNEFGLISAWQAANPTNDKPDQTLRWTGDRGAKPYHCDGIFIPERWKTQVQCNVINGTDWDKLSDHNPVIADII